MSGAASSDDVPKSAVPLPDMSALDPVLRRGGDPLRDVLKQFRPADLGRELSRRPLADGRRILEAMDERKSATAVKSAHPLVAGRLLGHCEPGHAARLLGFLPTDHQVAILGQLDAAERGRIEGQLGPEAKARIDRLLAYPPAAVGRLMSPTIWRAAADATVGDALAELDRHKDEIEVAQNCYVVRDERLVGVVPLRQLAILPRAQALAEVMTRDPIAVGEHTDRSDAAEIIRTHDFLSLPVIDGDGRLVGAVRVDDLLDAALDKLGAGLLNQGAVSGRLAGNVPYFQTSLRRVVRSRLTWLVLLFVAETATGTVLRFFEDELAKVVALSFFIPLLIGTGGNAGSQTVSTVIRALALGEVQPRDLGRVVMREITAGVMLGVLLGSIAFGRALLWGVGKDLAACVGVTVLAMCTWANAVGASIPLVATRLKIDPTVMSAPLITTLVDASGLFIYFSVAHIMISALH